MEGSLNPPAPGCIRASLRHSAVFAAGFDAFAFRR